MKTWRDIRTPVRELKKKKNQQRFPLSLAEAIMWDRLLTDECAKSSSEVFFVLFFWCSFGEE